MKDDTKFITRVHYKRERERERERERAREREKEQNKLSDTSIGVYASVRVE